MITYTDALFALVVVAHVCGLVVAFALYREVTGARDEARIRADALDARADNADREAVARDRALAKLLAPILRPPARPVRGFLGHVPGAEPTRPREPKEGAPGAVGDDVDVAAVVVWRRHERGEDAERTVREVAS